MSKVTLRKVENGIVATVDERPNSGDWYYRTQLNQRESISDNHYDELDYKIIASTIEGVGMELVLPEVWLILENEPNTEYEYKIEGNKLIIKL